MFLASTTYKKKQMTIEKMGLLHQVWSHGGSTFEKKGHKTAEIPAMQKLTHMGKVQLKSLFYLKSILHLNNTHPFLLFRLKKKRV